MKDSENAAGSFWTLQEFTRVGRNRWYALQQHTENGVERQYTGFKHELEHLVNALGIAPCLLPATTETEFWRTYGFEPTNMREAHVDSGIYRGPIVGVTPHSVIQEIAPKNFVAHTRDSMKRLPDIGTNVVVAYSNGRGSVQDVPLRELTGKARRMSR